MQDTVELGDYFVEDTVELGDYFVEDTVELGDYFVEVIPPNSTITFCLPKKPTKVPKFTNGTKCRILVNSQPSNQMTLREAGIEYADSVVCGGLSNLPANEADALLAMAVMQLGGGLGPYLIAPMNCLSSRSKTLCAAPPSASSTAAGCTSVVRRFGPLHHSPHELPQLQIQDAVCSSSRTDAPYLIAPMNRLSSKSTIESYLKNLKAVKETVSFAEIFEAVRHYGETSIAICRKDGSMLISPRPKATLVLEEGDLIAVFGDDMFVLEEGGLIAVFGDEDDFHGKTSSACEKSKKAKAAADK
eukprot:gene6568-3220_t